MKKIKISSDILFFRLLAGGLLGPVTLFIILKLFGTPNFLHITMVILYITLSILTIVSILSLFKYKQVYLIDNGFYIRSYFIGKNIEVDFSRVKEFSLIKKEKKLIGTLELYKIIYIHDEKSNKVLFNKSLKIDNRVFKPYLTD